MQLDFTGKKVLVTGASTGIGAATAHAFGAAGATVGVHYNQSRDAAEKVAACVEQEGGKAVLLQGDLCEESTCVAVVEQFAAAADGIDVLVNNAGGLLLRTAAENYDTATFDKTFTLNVTSAFVCTRTAVPYLRKSGGASVVFLSSVATRFGPPGVVAYASAKTALNGMTQCLSREYVADGIRVNAVAPGIIDTPFHAATPPDRLKALSEMIPMKRMGRPEEVASVILFLASDAASYITGHCIDVNGGMHLRC